MMDRIMDDRPGQQIRVLILGEAAIRASIARRLGDAQVTHAASITEAIDQIATTAPEVVINGESLASAQTLLTAHPDLDVVQLTHERDPAFESRAEELGIADVLGEEELNDRAVSRLLRQTLRRRADRHALQESELHHRQVLRHLPGALVTLYDRDLRCVLMEGAYLAETGIDDTSQFIGRHITDIGPSDEVAVLVEPMRRALQGNSACVDYEVHATGQLLIVDVAPYRDETGAVTGVVNVSRDVTSERAIELKRRIAEERFRVSFDRAPNGMAIVGLDGRFQQVNAALCDLLGMPAERVCELEQFSIVHPEDLATVQRAFGALSPDRPDLSLEHRIVDARGLTIWTQADVTLILDEAGAPLHALAQVQDVTERRHNEDELNRLANHDPLTGLLNRRGFERRLDEHLARARRHDPEGALIVLDLDGFKRVNDARGHSAGDELMLTCTDALQARLRESDALGRLGGDEFAVLIPSGGHAEAELVAEAVVVTVRQNAAADQVTASAGVALFESPTLTRDEMLANADAAMYEAKRAGRDRYATYGRGRTADPTG